MIITFDPGADDFEAVRRVEVNLPHSSPTLNIRINIVKTGSAPNQWGVSNFNITLLLCDISCDSCNGSTENSCLTCKKGFKRINETKEASGCEQDCSQFQNCASCTALECFICKKDFFLSITDYFCYRSCPLGSYSLSNSSSFY